MHARVAQATGGGRRAQTQMREGRSAERGEDDEVWCVVVCVVGWTAWWTDGWMEIRRATDEAERQGGRGGWALEGALHFAPHIA